MSPFQAKKSTNSNFSTASTPSISEWDGELFTFWTQTKQRQVKKPNSPPPIKELKLFQDGLVEIARNLQFRDVNDQFQKQLKDDLKNIRNDKKVIVAADKTRNFYKMEKENYKELLNNNITKDYKKTDDNTVKDI